MREVIFACMLISCVWLAQATAQDQTTVKLSAFSESDKVPLNRTATYVIRLEWSGAQSVYEFEQPETPRLSNFKLAGSSSSNSVRVAGGANTSVKTFEYLLRPQELGMGYVEGGRLGYVDKATGERHTLYTDRLGIQIIDPVAEPGEAPLGLIMLLGVGLAGILAGLVLYWQRRKQQEERARAAAQAAKPLEEEFLEQLRASVDLNTTETRTAFYDISRLLRQYLTRRFEIPSHGITTAEVLAAYQKIDEDPHQLTRLEEVLQTSDVFKFSGETGDPARLARIYALTEAFLEQQKANGKKKTANSV